MKLYTGTLMSMRGTTATIRVPASRQTKPTTVVLEVARCAKVTRNGGRARLDELQPGDNVEVKGTGGLATDVRALRRAD
jgi:hypothetical protein